MRTVKVGIVGSGFIGPAHVEALRRLPGVEVVALAEVTSELASQRAGQLGILRGYGSFQDLVNDEQVEVVHDCAPNHLHFEINRAALLAGKHVVSEKPLALTSQESAQLVDLAAESGRKHAVCFNYSCFPLVQQCRAMVDRGELGQIRLAHGSYLQDWLVYETDYNWRIEPQVGGKSRAVADIGSHWCATVQYAVGSPITEVFSDMATILPVRKRPTAAILTFSGAPGSAPGGRGQERTCEDVQVATEDYASVLIRFANGARGVFTVSQVSHGRKNRLYFEIDGSRAAVAWDQESPDALWIGRRSAANSLLMRDPGLVDPAVRGYVTYPGGHSEGWPDGLKNLLNGFYADVRSEPHTWYPTFHEGHHEMLVVDAVLESARLGRWVKVGAGEGEGRGR